MIVVSYGTRDGVYDRHLSRLERDLNRRGLTHDLRVVKRERGKKLVQLRKPEFILARLEGHGRTVVWLDADTRVLRPFTLPVGEWDVGVVPNTQTESLRKNPTSSFVLAFRPTEGARTLLRIWAYLCAWPELSARRQDHKRLTWAREISEGRHAEVDLSDSLRGCLVRDPGTVKEAAL